MEYHEPVLLEESIEWLAIRRDGTYIDATFGGGGHSRRILEVLGDKGRLYGFDQDEEAIPNIPKDERFTFVHHNFRYMKRFLRFHGVERVDGILADLGVSSHQFDRPERGFSYRFDSPLDMRMNRQLPRTAADLLNDYEADRLQDIFSRYGQVRNARTLARAIVEARERRLFSKVSDLLELLDALVRGARQRYMAQVFQALRIEVNDEMGALREFLQQSVQYLKPGGRLVVISYHSVEDRMVKNTMKTGGVEGRASKDFYGNVQRPLRPLTKKPVRPSDEEVARNPRARSARLRAAERLPDTEKGS
ncbi:MAG: 16S rRNA (cytosine(1402)-N(4))-methyltransferase RsmH [Saprospiraceae bacterium]|nr:16S rRNA (cytosine(1402)-N(4))-methyltransferase RsmH [Saprospiraceae bacterium]